MTNVKRIAETVKGKMLTDEIGRLDEEKTKAVMIANSVLLEVVRVIWTSDMPAYAKEDVLNVLFAEEAEEADTAHEEVECNAESE